MTQLFSPIAARSLHGCWTCRARRKKCDERQPFCAACASQQLECHGYGVKPSWMDNGPLQKERALHFKHIVSLNKTKKARQKKQHQQLALVSQSPVASPGSLPTDSPMARMEGLHGGMTMPSAEIFSQDLQNINMLPINDLTGWVLHDAPSSLLRTESASSYLVGAGSYSQPGSITLDSTMDTASGAISLSSYVHPPLTGCSSPIEYPQTDGWWGDMQLYYNSSLHTAFEKSNESSNVSWGGNYPLMFPSEVESCQYSTTNTYDSAATPWQ